AGGRPALSMPRGQHELVSSLVGAARPGVGAVVGTARTLGSALNVYDTAAGLVRGDPVQATGGAGGLAAGSLGPAVGAAWGAGWTAGGLAHEGMQGTRYGDAVARRNDEATRTLRAFGMPLVPGSRALGAWDALTGGDADPTAGGRRAPPRFTALWNAPHILRSLEHAPLSPLFLPPHGVSAVRATRRCHRTSCCRREGSDGTPRLKPVAVRAGGSDDLNRWRRAARR